MMHRLTYRALFFLIIVSVLTTWKVHALKAVILLASRRRNQVECKRTTSDDCCKYAVREEFMLLGIPERLIPVESHGTVYGTTQTGEVSFLSMITYCHDTRPRPLPISSPLRYLNVPVHIHCSGYNEAETYDENLEYAIDVDNVVHIDSRKGHCIPHRERRDQFLKKRIPVYQKISARKKAITAARMLAKMHDDAESSAAPGRRTGTMCADIEEPTYVTIGDPQYESALRMLASLAVPEDEPPTRQFGLLGPFSELNPRDFDLNKLPKPDS